MTATDWGRSMTDVDHTHPHDDPCLGDAFCRGGQRIAADGGRRGAGPEDDREESADKPVMDPETREPTMREVSHTPPTGDGANDVFQRGYRDDGSERSSPAGDGNDPTGAAVDDGEGDGDDRV